MYRIDGNIVKISVRNLVEFIMRSGDIDNRYGQGSDPDAMQEGSKAHRMIQKSKDSLYQAEVPLMIQIPLNETGIVIQVEGRADGIFQEEGQTFIDEIKGMYQDLEYIDEPIAVHRGQALCYAYIYGSKLCIEEIGLQLTYCNLESKELKFFRETMSLSEVEEWFLNLVSRFGDWAIWQMDWIKERNESMKQLDFPFEYRPGQNKLVKDVYRTIIRDKKLYIEAPTGVGKTISTIYPSVKSMGEGLASKIFYLTAKTITRTVAEDTYGILFHRGLRMKVVTITAKEKICVLDKSDCNPDACERAKGHYDRINVAVYDMLVHEVEITRELIEEYAEKHKVCPFEMSLDITSWADGIICDYNYVFDPHVYLRRFFSGEKKNDYVFLVDEAHNLVERGRSMYSASLYKKHFLEGKKLVQSRSHKLAKRLEVCNKDLLKLKRECDDFEVIDNIQDVALHLLSAMGEMESFLKENKGWDQREDLLELYFNIGHFLYIYEKMDDKYVTYTDYDEVEGFHLRLQCMDPSANLLECLEKGRCSVMFSATLLPIQYYKEQLGGKEEDYAVYAPSPFSTDNRLIMIAKDVSTKYSRRTTEEYEKIIEYMIEFTKVKQGNYLVFFPSYHMMNQVLDQWSPEECSDLEIVIQNSHMSEMQKEEFLATFQSEPTITRIGFCVLGGIFSEGIDLKEDRLIGAVIVGTGLPMVCNERELFRDYYEEKQGTGFEYAYLYQGMNKVLQSAGRVIRTIQDKGAILLLDERFQQNQYQRLFPREWYPNTVVDKEKMISELKEFWFGDGT